MQGDEGGDGSEGVMRDGASGRQLMSAKIITPIC